MQRPHDMGGNPAGEIDLSQHTLAPWQKQVHAMRQVLGDEKRQLLRVDELRRAIEDLPPEQYNSLEYFDRWVRAVRVILVEKGVLTDAEINERMAVLRAARENA
jgi:hypothetical protein